MYLLSFDYMSLLQNKGVLHKLAEITYNDSNPFVASIFGEIVFNYIEQAVENDSML